MIRKAPITMIMTEPVITLNRTDSLEKAEYLFKHHHIRHIPVVEDKEVIGMLSYTDLQRLSFIDITTENQLDTDAMVYNMFTINQIMKKKVVSVCTSNSIKEVAEVLASREFHALPVLENNQLVGIVTTTDLIRYLIKQF
ncbi:CBS domain-containing protein [Seonamhaeicola sp. ML3]|uniref:CBS domain-containing protein n=1 Tax=Seonamhaeicola sp. ML3 TaxID=2937786 RepID=UPI00200F2A0F|nr:CBS domain-containing protein [Seonamhaeicola sp. ML3]